MLSSSSYTVFSRPQNCPVLFCKIQARPRSWRSFLLWRPCLLCKQSLRMNSPVASSVHKVERYGHIGNHKLPGNSKILMYTSIVQWATEVKWTNGLLCKQWRDRDDPQFSFSAISSRTYIIQCWIELWKQGKKTSYWHEWQKFFYYHTSQRAIAMVSSN